MRLLVVLLLISSLAKSQIDSAMTVPLVGVNFGGQAPAGDMVNRYGPNLNFGGAFLLKTKRNWIVGLNAGYLFGRNVKTDVLAQVRNSDGFVVDNEGYPADLRINERGLTVQLVLGRVFKLLSANPNSGLMVTVGGGYMQHQIHFYDAQQRIAAVKGDLKYGYDRLSNGYCVSEFIGYLFLSESRLLNFYFGIESIQGFTQSVRKMNYDTGLPDTEKHLDILNGFKVGWILPLYKRTPNEYYID